MLQPIEVRKVLLQKVTDASGLEELIEKGVFRADDVIGASWARPKATAGSNDFTRLSGRPGVSRGARGQRDADLGRSGRSRLLGPAVQTA